MRQPWGRGTVCHSVLFTSFPRLDARVKDDVRQGQTKSSPPGTHKKLSAHGWENSRGEAPSSTRMQFGVSVGDYAIGRLVKSFDIAPTTLVHDRNRLEVETMPHSIQVRDRKSTFGNQFTERNSILN